MSAPFSPSAGASPQLEHARNLIRQGRMDEAEHLEALNIVALGALKRGDAARAASLLEPVTRGGGDPGTLKNLGLAYQQGGRLAGGLRTFCGRRPARRLR